MNMTSWLIIFAKYTGLTSAILYFFRKRIPILMLHGVIDPEKNDLWRPSWDRISEKDLETAISVLGKKYKMVSIDTATKMIQGTIPTEPYTLVLTFDDGYSNNITHAWPILKRHNAEMTLYVATKYSKDRLTFWIDRIDYALYCLAGRTGIEISVKETPFVFNLEDRKSYETSYSKFRQAVKQLKFDNDYDMLSALDNAAEQLEAISGSSLYDILENDPWTRPVKMEELKHLDNGILIGAHTVNHIRVTHVDSPQLEYELREARSELEDATGNKCEHFCYPNGDCDDQTADYVRNAGYQSAVSCEIGTNNRKSNMFQLRRLTFPNLDCPTKIDFWLAKEFLKEYFIRG